MTDTRKYFEKMIIDAYCNGDITKEEAKERIAEREKAERRKAIERYLDLYIEDRITKDALLDTLSE